jgi:hypothetical protein
VGRFINRIDGQIRAKDGSYYRGQYQTFMTGPEWRNVEMAEEFSAFMKSGRSMFQFPYLSQIWDLWKVTYQSYAAARRYDGRYKLWTSEYILMALFVSTFTTFEFIPKGILSFFLRPFLKRENKTDFQDKLADYFDVYAKRLQTIPFYNHPYRTDREMLAKVYSESNNKTWGDWVTWKCVSFELLARRIVSIPLYYWFNQEGNVTPDTTDILVKYRAENIADSGQAKEKFKTQLEQASANEQGLPKEDKKVTAAIVDQQYVKPMKDGKTYSTVYARLRVPRYADFQPTLRALEAQDISLRKIAGQDRVQVKCLHAESDVKGALAQPSPIYSYGDRINAARKFHLFDMPVVNLYKQLQRFDNYKDQGVEVKFIHNF